MMPYDPLSGKISNDEYIVELLNASVLHRFSTSNSWVICLPIKHEHFWISEYSQRAFLLWNSQLNRVTQRQNNFSFFSCLSLSLLLVGINCVLVCICMVWVREHSLPPLFIYCLRISNRYKHCAVASPKKIQVRQKNNKQQKQRRVNTVARCHWRMLRRSCLWSVKIHICVKLRKRPTRGTKNHRNSSAHFIFGNGFHFN